MLQVEGITRAGTNTLMVNHAHLLAFDEPLAQAIADEFMRFGACRLRAPRAPPGFACDRETPYPTPSARSQSPL